jgi:hypothetical protein
MKMKRLLTALVLILLAAPLFSYSSKAEEPEIKSTGGAFLGKWKFKEIGPADALLEVPREGRRLIRVRAGYVGNSRYREFWRFDNSWLTYDKLSSGSHFNEVEFNKKDAPRIFCGSPVNQKCDVLKSEKLSRNLIIVTFRWRKSGATCAGLSYIDEEFLSEGFGASFGDYHAGFGTCLSATSDAREAVALSAHYLSLVKKDGRPIARLSRYDLPKPRKPSETPSKKGTRDSAYGRAPDNRVCNMATEDGEWQRQRSLQKWVVEARERGLTLEDCEEVRKAK